MKYCPNCCHGEPKDELAICSDCDSELTSIPPEICQVAGC